MPFAGRSYLGLIAVEGIVIATVFYAVARLSRASRWRAVAALVGGLVAGAGNVATDALAHRFGWWHYPEATTPFGPLLYYVEAGVGCGALALVAVWLRQRHGGVALGTFLAYLAVYGPIRDAVTARTTGLIEFDYDPLPVVVVADALSGFIIPVLVAYGVINRFGSGPPGLAEAAGR